MGAYKFLIVSHYLTVFSYQVQGRSSSVCPLNPQVNEGKIVVETWGRVLVNSGYADYVLNV